jgi:hypothetical protein
VQAHFRQVVVISGEGGQALQGEHHMSDALAATGQAEAPARTPEKTVYEASGARKLAFSFAFLLLLPFFASLPAMLFWRISQGHWLGTLGLMVLGIGFAFIMFLVVVELMRSLRSRLEIGDTAVRMTLPFGAGADADPAVCVP